MAEKLGSFNEKVDLAALADKMKTTVADAQKLIGMTLYKEIVAGNPVDTGFSASNWNLSVGAPDYSVSGERDPKATYAPKEPSPPDNPDMEPIFISNGVDYVIFLEEGHSQQAPTGFIQVAIEKVRNSVDEFIREASSQ
jgi:hypothetical protein